MGARLSFKTAPQHTDWAGLRDFWREGDRVDHYSCGWLFDHFYPIFSDPVGPCFEGWTLLSVLAGMTERVRLGIMVTGNPYRHPAVLANMAATVDVASEGRLEIGIGAGWNQMESDAYGIDLPALKERFDRLEEQLEAILGLWTTPRGGRFSFEGSDVRIDRLSLGHGIFTDPEIGSVGLTEAAARGAGHDVAVGLVTFDKIEKAELIGAELGLIKYVVERESRRLLGCHVIGRQASDLVWSASVVLRRRGTLDELATAVGIFPTLAEGMEGTARGLLRRLAPNIVAGPLAVARTMQQAKEVAMTASGSFTCPACGAEFDVQERLDDQLEPEPQEAPIEAAAHTAAEPVSFQCPACGADYETQERLDGVSDSTT